MNLAAKRGCIIAWLDRAFLLWLLVSTAPTNLGRGIVWGVRRSRRFPARSGGFAVKARALRWCDMAPVNWSRIATRNRMRWQSVEDVKDGTPVVAPVVRKQARRRLSKAELREQARATARAIASGVFHPTPPTPEAQCKP